MKSGSIRAFTTASFAGLAVAIALSQGELVSLRTWTFAAATILVGAALARLISEARVAASPRIPAWWPLRRRRTTDTGVIRSLRALEGIVRDSARNPRVHTLRLQPRLIEIAQHYLPLTHGIDLDRDPDLAHEVLSDVAWLIDPHVVDRTPTFDEIDRFVDLVRNVDSERLTTT